MTTSAALSPFVAWLAIHERDELLRRRYRQFVEAYLAFAAARGAPSSRWEATLPRTAGSNSEARRALDRFDEHQTILARTEIPVSIVTVVLGGERAHRNLRPHR